MLRKRFEDNQGAAKLYSTCVSEWLCRDERSLNRDRPFRDGLKDNQWSAKLARHIMMLPSHQLAER